MVGQTVSQTVGQNWSVKRSVGQRFLTDRDWPLTDHDRPLASLIVNHPLLKDRHLKYQSRLYISSFVKEGIINIERVEDVIDFVKWITKAGQTKSTNRIDDILSLIPIGYKLFI